MARQLRKMRWLSEDGQKVMTAEIGRNIEGDTSTDYPYGEGLVSAIIEIGHVTLVHVPHRSVPITVTAEMITERVPSDESKG
jgi:hypothetical protein